MGNAHLAEPAGQLHSCCGPFGCACWSAPQLLWPLSVRCTFPNTSRWVCVLPCWSPSGFPEPTFDWTFPAALVAQIAVLDQGLLGRRHGYSFTVTAEARVGAMTDSLTGKVCQPLLKSGVLPLSLCNSYSGGGGSRKITCLPRRRLRY